MLFLAYFLWLLLKASASSGTTSAGSCYDMTTHQVSCNVAETSCASPKFWYAPGYVSQNSGCCHCKASCMNLSDSCTYYDAPTSAGSCYDMTTHQVSCDVAETSCASPKFWYAPGYVSQNSGCCHCKASCMNLSDSCTYYDVTDATTTTQAMQSTTTPHPVWGCYDVSSRTCDCDVSETQCAGTWTRGCTSCQEGRVETSGTKSSSMSMTLLFATILCSLFMPLEAGTGCYNVETHQCDCRTTEAACHQRNGVWSDACRSCDQSTNTNHPECQKEYSWGCFNSMSHSCECTVSERACDTAVNKTWTHECWSCCHGSAWGCFVPGSGPESGCHCGLYEGACKLDFPDATWSHQCFECEEDQEDQKDQQQIQQVVDNTALVAILVTVSTLLVLGVFVGIYVLLRKNKSKQPVNEPYNSPPLDTADVVVGRAMPGTSNSKQMA